MDNLGDMYKFALGNAIHEANTNLPDGYAMVIALALGGAVVKLYCADGEIGQGKPGDALVDVVEQLTREAVLHSSKDIVKQ